MNKENIDKQEKSMFIPDTYIPALIEQLKRFCSDRLIYVGLQGSYLRGRCYRKQRH